MTAAGIPGGLLPDPEQGVADADRRWQHFLTNIQYCRRMLQTGKALEDQEALEPSHVDFSSAHCTDLYRATWVQAVSALDHWLHREIVDRVANGMNETGWARPDKLKKLKVSWELVEIAAAGKPLESIARDHLSERLTLSTFQKAEKIAEGLGYVTSDSKLEIWGKVAQRFGQRCEEVITRHDEIIDRRNKIAHEADQPDGAAQRSPIKADEAEAVIDWIEAVAGALREVFP
jgi:hypothetical protein